MFHFDLTKLILTDSINELFRVDLHSRNITTVVNGRHSCSCGLAPILELYVIIRPSVSQFPQVLISVPIVLSNGSVDIYIWYDGSM